MKKVYKLVLMFVDHDNLGEQGVKDLIHHTRYPLHILAPVVMDAESVEVEWDDGHPLNYISQRDRAFADLFPDAGKEERIEHLRMLAEEYAMLEHADFLAEAAVGTLERAVYHIDDEELKGKLALDTLQRRVDQYQETVKRLR